MNQYALVRRPGSPFHHEGNAGRFAMNGRKAFTVLALSAALGASGTTLAVAQYEHDGGHVKPCSLHGVNPAHHPEIFGDAAAAQEHYGFVKSKDGKWRVEKDCRKHGHHAELSFPILSKGT
jgi:hypothetical protein